MSNLWELGKLKIRERRIHGVAKFKAATVRLAELEIESKEPPPRHANIISWPTNADQTMDKAKCKEFAFRIASETELILKD